MTTEQSIYLTEADIDAIERLLGRVIELKCKNYLLEYYGAGGVLNKWRKWHEVKSLSCKRCCSSCGCCAFDTPDSILTQVLDVIKCFDLGLLDTECDSYHQVRNKLAYHASNARQLSLF